MHLPGIPTAWWCIISAAKTATCVPLSSNDSTWQWHDCLLINNPPHPTDFSAWTSLNWKCIRRLEVSWVNCQAVELDACIQRTLQNKCRHFLTLVTLSTIVVLLYPLSRIGHPPESKGLRLSFSLCMKYQEECPGSLNRRGRNKEKEGCRLWNLKSMHHCNARRNSQPYMSPRKKMGAIDRRPEEVEL